MTWLASLVVTALVLPVDLSRAHAAPTTTQDEDDSDDGDAPATAPPAPAVNPNAPTTFESLAREATQMSDLGTLLGPFAGKCDGEKRDIDRMRCRTARAYLRKAIPQRSFWAVVDDPDTLSVSEYDGAIKGYHLSVSGCLACAKPVVVGRTNEQRLITVKAPEIGRASCRERVSRCV